MSENNFDNENKSNSNGEDCQNIENRILKSNCETHQHIDDVRKNINHFIEDLILRAENHDQSKLDSPEKEIFGEHHELLAKTTYGTPEYDDLLKKVQPALDHHYSKNRHHPQYWPDGINDMTLTDLIEMLSDWMAAISRVKNGNIKTSLIKNKKRFKISKQLYQILQNTVREFQAQDQSK